MAKVTSDDLFRALAVRYPARRYATMREVGNGTGSNVRRHVDLVAMGIWPSQGLHLEAIEVKVSRDDWLRELRQPLKQEQSVFRWMDFWWVAAPVGVVELEELPSAWGLLELRGGGLVIAKAAPKLEPEPPSRDFLAALLRRMPPDDDPAALAEMRAALRAEAEEAANSRLKHEVAALQATVAGLQAEAEAGRGAVAAQIALAKALTKVTSPEDARAWSADAAAKLAGVRTKGEGWRASLATGRIEGAGLELHGPGGAGELMLAADAPRLAERLVELAGGFVRLVGLLPKGADLGKA